MTTSSVLMKEVRSHIGEGGSVFQRWAGIPGQAWCDACVSYCLNKTDNGSLYCDGAKEINCPHSMNWCIKHLAAIPIYLAMEGDVSFFDWQPNGLPDHVGFVDERINADYYYTIEGNTSGGIVARRKRSDKEEQLTFRLHYTPTAFSADKKLEVDGIAGYNTIAVMQRWLNVDKDAILGQGTVKALQRKLGVTADGLWGTKTTKALQKLVGTTQDGLLGPATVKALQNYLNAHAFTTSWVDQANAWARKIAGEKYHYVRWKSGDAKTKTCPVCNGRKYDDHYGWNCIGFAFACWHHGGGLKNKCSCGVISSGKGGQWDRLLTDSQSTANANATKWTGVPCTVIRNGGKALTKSMLKAGDILCMYSGGTAQHIIYYMGNGKFAESNSSGSADKHIRADLTLSSSWLSKIKVAVRYVGK